jgi:uncharacterized protein (DUF362 family)
MDRRQFLQTSAEALAGVAAAGALSPLLSAAATPDLAVAHGTSPGRAARAAVEALGGIRRFIAKGDVVVVKPNIGWNRTPEFAATTNPELVAALVRMCLEAGAGRVKVFDRTCNDARWTYRQSGIEEAAKNAGAEVSFVDERRFRQVRIPHGTAIQSWPIYQDVLEADKLVNVPIAKHHSMARLTLAHKNLMGVMGEERGLIHQHMDEALVDLSTVVKPCLTVLDAARVLTAHGPQGGSLADVKQLDTVVAGTDLVAVDAFGATLFGLRGADLGCVREAARRGLGVMDLGRLSIRRLEA